MDAHTPPPRTQTLENHGRDSARSPVPPASSHSERTALPLMGKASSNREAPSAESALAPHAKRGREDSSDDDQRQQTHVWPIEQQNKGHRRNSIKQVKTRAIRAGPSCLRCRLSKHACDEATPCRSCPPQEVHSAAVWKFLGCSRGTLSVFADIFYPACIHQSLKHLGKCFVSDPLVSEAEMSVEEFIRRDDRNGLTFREWGSALDPQIPQSYIDDEKTLRILGWVAGSTVQTAFNPLKLIFVGKKLSSECGEWNIFREALELLKEVLLAFQWRKIPPPTGGILFRLGQFLDSFHNSYFRKSVDPDKWYSGFFAICLFGIAKSIFVNACLLASQPFEVEAARIGNAYQILVGIFLRSKSPLLDGLDLHGDPRARWTALVVDYSNWGSRNIRSVDQFLKSLGSTMNKDGIQSSFFPELCEQKAVVSVSLPDEIESTQDEGIPANAGFYCPYYMQDPQHHALWCEGKIFTSIARLKEHLYRKHTTPIQCPLLCSNYFRDIAAFNQHIATGPCVAGQVTVSIGMTPAMEKQMRKRTRGRAEDKWREMWEILFPNSSAPTPWTEAMTVESEDEDEEDEMDIDKPRYDSLASDRTSSTPGNVKSDKKTLASSRGPQTRVLTTAQRTNLSLMKKIGACDNCRKRKVQCSVEHHDLQLLVKRRILNRDELKAIGLPVDHEVVMPTADHEASEPVLIPSAANSTIWVLPPTRSLTTTHENVRSQHHIDLQRFGENLQAAVANMFPNYERSKYSRVAVLFLSWEDEDRNAPESSGIHELSDVFENLYHFHTEHWIIPIQKSHNQVSRKMLDYVEEYDKKSDLKLLYYAGYSMLSNTRALVLSPRPKEQGASHPSVKFGGILNTLESGESDTLMILDCENGAGLSGIGSIPTSGNGLLELITPISHAQEAGPHSLTSALIAELRLLGSKPPSGFSVGSLYTRIITRMHHIIPSEKYGHSLPIHLILNQDEASPRSIFLNPMPPKDSSLILTANPDESTFLGASSPGLDPSTSKNSLSLSKRLRSARGPKLTLSFRLSEKDDPVFKLSTENFVEWLRSIPATAEEVKIEAGFGLL